MSSHVYFFIIEHINGVQATVKMDADFALSPWLAQWFKEQLKATIKTLLHYMFLFIIVWLRWLAALTCIENVQTMYWSDYILISDSDRI